MEILPEHKKSRPPAVARQFLLPPDTERRVGIAKTIVPTRTGGTVKLLQLVVRQPMEPTPQDSGASVPKTE